MEMPLITTKLYRPAPPPAAIPRPPLLAKLARGAYGKLTILVAPAGFGKSTLISQWTQTVEQPVAWLALDEHDNDAPRFLRYLIAAVQSCAADFGEQTLALLHGPQPPLTALLTTFVNELARLPQPILLVLDDYHLIDTPAIHDIVDFGLSYCPPTVHWVIISRREPPLALARLRVQGALTEVSAADLRFSPAEVAAFFATTVGLALPMAAIATLEQRTEGWVAGLRLAAVLLQTAVTVEHSLSFDEVLAHFRGDDRHVLDYLTAEVFDRLTPDRQQFLIRTALLDRLCAPLCDAVTARRDSQQQLDALAREHLFLLPLDHQRQWYRYHPLFADFLRHRLRQQPADMVRSLHQRAATWYAANGFVEVAIEHAVQAPDVALTVQLLETHALHMTRSNEVTALARWLDAVPLAQRRGRPLLAFAQAGVALLTSQFAAAKQWVETAEQALTTAPSTNTPLSAATLQGYLDALRCTAMVNLRDDVSEIIAVAQRALRHLPADETFLRGAVALNLGDAYARQQAATAAATAFAEAVALTEQNANLIVHLAALGSQGGFYEHEGDLHRAAAIYRRGIAAGEAWGQATGLPHPATGKVYAFYANVLYAWNQLVAAEAQARKAVGCCRQWGHTQHLVDSYLALVHSLQAQDKVTAAEETLATARLIATTAWQRAQEQGSDATAAGELQAMVDYTQLWLWQRQAQWTTVADWLAGQTSEASPALSLARVRVALADEALATAAHWLTHIEERLVPALSHVGRGRLQLLQARLYAQQGDHGAALTALRRTLDWAEPSGYIRLFVDEGAPVAALLAALLQQSGGSAYSRHVLAAFPPPISIPGTGGAPASALVESLSERELDVLRLIAADLTYEAIAEQLIISLNTVRTHTKNIYSKLNVHRRNQAVAQARKLGLL